MGSHESNAKLSQDNNVKRCQGKYNDKSAVTFQENNVNKYQDRNVATFQDSSVKMYHDKFNVRNVEMSQGNSAIMSRVNNAKMFPGNNVEMYQDRFANNQDTVANRKAVFSFSDFNGYLKQQQQVYSSHISNIQLISESFLYPITALLVSASRLSNV